jgi:N-acyl-D-aspartate/D-glutamate deacylase
MIDCLITNGRIVDGTGRPSVYGAVAIDGGRVVAVGDGDATSARRVIDAEGRCVAPGLIDPHTHFDAQLMWDPTASPAIFHGITTVIAGNCGYTIAPARPRDVRYLAQMMAGSEGIPLGAIETALDWGWESFGDWLGRLDGALAVNAGFQVGHSALRRYVMGDDAVTETATPEQVEQLTTVLHASLAAGALGFSTSRNEHTDMHGQPVPSRAASREELLALATACRDHPGTSLEISPETGAGGRFSDEFIDLMVTMSAAANRPMNWNVLRLYGPDVESAYQRLSSAETADERGGRIVVLTNPEVVRHRLTFLTPFILDDLPGCWHEILHRPVPERLAALRDPAVRQQMQDDAAKEKTIGNRRGLIKWGDHTFVECFTPETKRQAEGHTIAEVAEARGVDPFDALLDVVVADELRTRILLKARGDDDETWRLRLELIRNPHTLIGGSDGGAHLDFQVGATLTSSFLAQAVRERAVLSLEEAVHHLTQAPAAYYGLVDRGTLTPGAWADVVVFDPETVGPQPVEARTDLPGGCGRMYAGATGIERVLVNGVEVVRDGSCTGDLPGRVLRSGVDTDHVVARR